MKKTHIVVLAALVAGCKQKAPSTAPTPPVRTGPATPDVSDQHYYLVAVSVNSAYWKDAQDGIKDRAAQLGVQAEMMGPAGPDAKEQADTLEELVSKKPAGILIAPAEPDAVKSAIDAAVDAGRHVYLEKPVAVDTSGSLRVQATGEKAADRLTVFVGFQSRSRPDFAEGIERVRQGSIGNIACGKAYYNSGWLSPRDKPGESEEEARIRNWVFDKVLSGDILVEQNIHMALKVAHRGMVIKTGRIRMKGMGEELIADPEIQKAYMGSLR